jgi:acetoacetyl-CoA synthetase
MQERNILWEPGSAFKENSNLEHFIKWLGKKGIQKQSYPELLQWSTDNLDKFWELQLEYFQIQYSGEYNHVMQGQMPEVKWFDGISLSYAEHIFRNSSPGKAAVIFSSETKAPETLSWEALTEKVSGLQQFLKSAGVKQGDRVAAYLPNIPEATIGFLAANSLGAIWSSCSPDFGTQAVLDRFVQIEPKVLIATDGYQYGGKYFSKAETLKEIITALPTVEEVIIVSSGKEPKLPFAFTDWSEIRPSQNKIEFTRVPFSHPIWILFSSGTTGIPKAITHGTGGILLEQLKYGAFHQDVKREDRCFWYTTTGWMMWNYLQGMLLAGGTLVLYDGHPAFPDRSKLWQLIDDCAITHFGISGSYIVSMMKSDFKPKDEFKFDSLRSIGSTGSPLPVEGFHWIYENVKKNVWLTSMSGGTDVCSAFVGGNPILPVYEGEIQCVALGCDLQVWDESGKDLQNEEGEMVITKPMPSMPVFFWNDPEFKKYKESYFEMFPGVWRHGDWIKQTPSGGLIIYGRSDATLNRGGVRIGSAEIYKTLDKIPEIKDSLIVCIDKPGGEFYMPLFVMLNENVVLDDRLKKKINQKLKLECSPRHVPDEILVCPDIPYTLSGKKTETPVKKILMGLNPEKVVNKGSLRNPKALEFFIALDRV